ncbi:hypothetical protein CVS40_11761 [Lucilia cuprina]|nr:hypothetical protein CVS40_11761 [Lucilia cuprina]
MEESSCPQCRFNNPTTHKLFLSFDVSNDNSNNLKELELKLKSSNEYNIKIIGQMHETEHNFMQIQRPIYGYLMLINRKLIKQNQTIGENWFRSSGHNMKSLELVKETPKADTNNLSIANEAKSERVKIKII